MSCALYCFRHRYTPKVFPVTLVIAEFFYKSRFGEVLHRVGQECTGFLAALANKGLDEFRGMPLVDRKGIGIYALSRLL